jgi:DNA-binding NarL/FixJ family response regulator
MVESPTTDPPRSEPPGSGMAWREASLAEASVPHPPAIHVALIEDNRLVREALVNLLGRFPDIRVSAEEPNGHEVLLKHLNPDVVLLDLGLENGDSLRVAKGVLRDFPGARVVVMDLLPAVEELTEFVSAGVSGFIMKDATIDAVLQTIRSVARGLKVLPDQMTGALFSEIAKEALSGRRIEKAQEDVRLTPREKEVIDLIAEGLSNKAVATRLEISTHTVKSHLRNIMEKLTLHSRLQIAAYAFGREVDDE